MPTPRITPASEESIPDCLTASSAATSANIVYRSSFLSCLRSKNSEGLKSEISPAIFTLKFSVSNCFINLIPDTPPIKLSHKDCDERPNGEMLPSPVMTTLFSKIS